MSPRLTAGPAVGRHVAFNADDRLDARFTRLSIEVHGAVQATVVRQRKSPKALLAGVLYKVRDAAQAIQQTVFRVCVEVSKHPA